MTNEAKHTPTPWKLGLLTEAGGDGGGQIAYVNADQDCVAKCDFGFGQLPAHANATLIVESVNSHAAIVAENARLREALELVLPMAKGYAHAHPVGSNALYIADAEAALSPKTEA